MDNLTGRKTSPRRTPTIGSVTKDHSVYHKKGEAKKTVAKCDDCGNTVFWGVVGQRYYRMLTHEDACYG